MYKTNHLLLFSVQGHMKWEKGEKGSLLYSFLGTWAPEYLSFSTQGPKVSLGIKIQLANREEKGR